MKTMLLALLLVCGWGHAAPAAAESLRCSGGIVAEGDTRLSLVHKCGEPLLRDAYCPAVYYPGSRYAVPADIGLAYVPCVPTEEWLYDRGPGNLMATVRLRNGRIWTITSGQPR